MISGNKNKNSQLKINYKLYFQKSLKFDFFFSIQNYFFFLLYNKGPKIVISKTFCYIINLFISRMVN